MNNVNQASRRQQRRTTLGRLVAFVVPSCLILALLLVGMYHPLRPGLSPASPQSPLYRAADAVHLPHRWSVSAGLACRDCHR